MQFQPGQSGNPGGRGKGRPWREALERAAKRIADGQKSNNLERAADACFDAAFAGDVSAMKEIGDRLEGKVAQVQILTGDEDGGPVKITRIEIVAPATDGEAK